MSLSPYIKQVHHGTSGSSVTCIRGGAIGTVLDLDRDRGYEVVGVCRKQSVRKPDSYKGRITVILGATNDRRFIKLAAAGCDGMLIVLAPMRIIQNSSGTVEAVLEYARLGACLLFLYGSHITLDGLDLYSWKVNVRMQIIGRLALLARVVNLDDQKKKCWKVFVSETWWTVVHGSDLEEGESRGLLVWSRHMDDPILKSTITRRVDFALLMMEALKNGDLVHKAPVIVGYRTPRPLALLEVETANGNFNEQTWLRHSIHFLKRIVYQ